MTKKKREMPIKLWDTVVIVDAMDPSMIGKRCRVTAVVKGRPTMYKLNFLDCCWLGSCLKGV